MSELTRGWDSAIREQATDPHVLWGAAVLSRLDPEGVATVIDAGCGTGRVTQFLLERAPAAHVVGIDASAQMLSGAAERLRIDIAAGRVELLQADLEQPLPIGPVDAIVSTATFHWIHDHDRLFANLATALRPGGQLVAQCGGAGNVATLGGGSRLVGESWAGGTHFATPEDTADLLRHHGFVGVETWLQEEPSVDVDYVRLNIVARRPR